jgi:male-specific lethal 1
MVWVDEEGVYESIADDIITGLEQASVVLVCMTQKYYESPYCKKEVVYAAESFKKIIPLTLEPRYNPHGWLRFHTSDGLRYDFSNEETFDESFRKLVQALRKVFESSSLRAAEKAKQSQQQQQQLTSTQQSSAGGHQEFLSQPSAPVVDAGLKSWTSAEVKNWLSSSGLQHLGHWFEGFDGEMLLEYKAYRQYSPETFASCVRDERENGRLTIADVMKLNKALKRL